MIVGFADGATEDVFHGGNTAKSRRWSKAVKEKAQKRLDALNAAVTLNDLRIPPGNRLKALKGNLTGRYHSAGREPRAVPADECRLKKPLKTSCQISANMITSTQFSEKSIKLTDSLGAIALTDGSEISDGWFKVLAPARGAFGRPGSGKRSDHNMCHRSGLGVGRTLERRA